MKWQFLSENGVRNSAVFTFFSAVCHFSFIRYLVQAQLIFPKEILSTIDLFLSTKNLMVEGDSVTLQPFCKRYKLAVLSFEVKIQFQLLLIQILSLG